MKAEENAERLGFSVGSVLVRVEHSFSFKVECEERTIMNIIFRETERSRKRSGGKE